MFIWPPSSIAAAISSTSHPRCPQCSATARIAAVHDAIRGSVRAPAAQRRAGHPDRHLDAVHDEVVDLAAGGAGPTHRAPRHIVEVELAALNEYRPWSG